MRRAFACEAGAAGRYAHAGVYARRNELEHGLDLLQGSLVEEPKHLNFISDVGASHNNNLHNEMSVREQPRTTTMGQP